MSVQFKMIPKKNNLVSPPEVKYYPCAVSQGEVNLDDLARIVASRTTMSRPDCFGVIMALSDVIGESLANGNIVRVDNLGTFQLTLTGTAADTEETLGKSNIKEAKINYRPSKELKNRMNSAITEEEKAKKLCNYIIDATACEEEVLQQVLKIIQK